MGPSGVNGGEHDRYGGGWGKGEQAPRHLAAAVFQHHVHVVTVSKVSVEGHDVAVSQAAVQGDLAFHLRVQESAQGLETQKRSPKLWPAFPQDQAVHRSHFRGEYTEAMLMGLLHEPPQTVTGCGSLW